MDQFTTTIESTQNIDDFRARALPELLVRLGSWGYRVTSQTEGMVVLTRERGGIFYYLFRWFHSLALTVTAEGEGTRLTACGNHGKVHRLLDQLAS